jgi:hypothetical protein
MTDRDVDQDELPAFLDDEERPGLAAEYAELVELLADLSELPSEGWRDRVLAAIDAEYGELEELLADAGEERGE